MLDNRDGSERIFLGEVAVDSGSLVVGDPTYLSGRDIHGDVGQAILSSSHGGPVATRAGADAQIVAFKVSSDGGYGVWGELDDYGQLSRVIIDLGTGEI